MQARAEEDEAEQEEGEEEEIQRRSSECCERSPCRVAVHRHEGVASV